MKLEVLPKLDPKGFRAHIPPARHKLSFTNGHIHTINRRRTHHNVKREILPV